MNSVRAIGHAARVLAGLAAVALAFTAAMPAALATTSPGRARLLSWADPPLPRGWNNHLPLPAHGRTLAAGGMADWQIALFAAAGVLATTAAVLLARAGAARRRAAASPA